MQKNPLLRRSVTITQGSLTGTTVNFVNSYAILSEPC
jgi:hypothetical protein